MSYVPQTGRKALDAARPPRPNDLKQLISAGAPTKDGTPALKRPHQRPALS
jgi:hypothetical protein